MISTSTTSLQYPIGKFSKPLLVDHVRLKTEIRHISELPVLIESEIKGVPESSLEAKYRPDGWTVRQVVHHLADSHLNSYGRFKLALTEENPVVKPYMEEKWAELPDSNLPVEFSMMMLTGIHARWSEILLKMSHADFEKTFFHPQSKRAIPLWEATSLYVWHGLHHLEHIRIGLGKSRI